MTSSTERILFLLKTRGRATPATLARALGISPQAVREQLARLRDDGLVTFEDETHGRGRPRRHWRLTGAGEGRFPDTHAELTVGMIAAIREELGEPALDRLIDRRARDTALAYRKALAPLSGTRAKVARLAELREAEGYMAEWSGSEDGGFILIENHCPICAAARACQGFCRAEIEVFRAALGAGCTVERTEHIPAGARRCAYRITGEG
jgi:predicted ArsR family transcriptional regulator